MCTFEKKIIYSFSMEQLRGVQCTGRRDSGGYGVSYTLSGYHCIYTCAAKMGIVFPYSGLSGVFSPFFFLAEETTSFWAVQVHVVNQYSCIITGKFYFSDFQVQFSVHIQWYV